MATNSNFWADIMIKFNKELFKRASTWLNAVSISISGVMVYVPDLPIDENVKSWIMLCCGLTVAASQMLSFGVNRNASES